MSRSCAEEFAESLRGLEPEERERLLTAVSEDEALALLEDWEWWARPEQLMPSGEWWHIWLILSGRGFGKTRAGAEWIHQRERAGFRRFSLVARTAADYRDVMIEGESGLLACAKRGREPEWTPSKRRLVWPSGAVAVCFSAEEPDSLRGPQCDSAWGDEPGTWKLLPGPDGATAFDNLLLGMRLGSDPRCVLTTTPKPIPLIKDLVKRERTDVVVTRGTTYDNIANVAPTFASEVIAKYEGTELGKQEIYGLLLAAREGALWTEQQLEQRRFNTPALELTIVGVDPPGAHKPGSAECGIVAVGLARSPEPTEVTQPDGKVVTLNLRHLYVLDDLSLRGSTEQWAQVSVAAARKLGAELVGEINYGGDMVRAAIRTADPALHFTAVTATRGKQIRAEPVQQLYEQGRCHHAGYFGDLEAQMVSWVPGERGPSPDRVDALVWACTALLKRAGSVPASFTPPQQSERRVPTVRPGRAPTAQQKLAREHAKLLRGR